MSSSPTWGERWAARIAVGLARLLAHASPDQIRRILELLRKGAAPAGQAAAEDLYRTILSVSPRCTGHAACLPRSLAVTLLGRSHGLWTTWCVGVRVRPPFSAHAWVEADGEAVGESFGSGYYQCLMAVGPRHDVS